MNIDKKMILSYSKDLTLLYVEDNDQLRNSTVDIFRNFFVNIDVALNGREGLEQYRNHKCETNTYYDIVISDIQMPEMNGLQMSEAIMSDNPEQVLIFMTAHNEAFYLHSAIKIGVVDFLIKPIDSEQLTVMLYKTSKAISEHKLIEKYYRQIEDLNKQLEDKNDDLESLVAKKTKDLKYLNKNLQDEVQRQLAVIREKDNQLMEQSRLASMGEMIGNIAHQWRQPLNVLGLHLQELSLLQMLGKLTAENLEENIQKGMEVINQMSTTIDDFRFYLEPSWEKEPFCLLEVIENSIGLTKAIFEESHISFQVDVDPDIKVQGNRNELSHVILNLLNNAKDALIECQADKRVITIRASSEGEQSLLTIKDNAGGISEDVIGKIFDPYFTTKEEGKGDGIGLFMSKRIIEEKMHGKISVENLDGGACFTILLHQVLPV